MSYQIKIDLIIEFDFEKSIANLSTIYLNE